MAQDRWQESGEGGTGRARREAATWANRNSGIVREVKVLAIDDGCLLGLYRAAPGELGLPHRGGRKITGEAGNGSLDSGAVERRSSGGGFFRDEEELFAAIEREVGPEAAQAARRSRQLMRNPRPLDDAERADLRVALEPVLRDLRGSGAIVPDVVEEAREDLGPDCVPAWIQPPGTPGSLVAGSRGRRVSASCWASRCRSGWPTWRISCRSGKSKSLPLPGARRPGRSARSTPTPTRWPRRPRRPGRLVLPAHRAGD
jgi:hypothetical protein